MNKDDDLDFWIKDDDPWIEKAEKAHDEYVKLGLDDSYNSWECTRKEITERLEECIQKKKSWKELWPEELDDDIVY